MTLQLPNTPFFLPPREGENSGVDFLGLRQTNLDMMAEMIPSLNNVTDYIRPFALLSWVFWKFPQLCRDAGIDAPSRKDIDQFREKIEVLFSWGASLHETSGRIPGTGASPPPSLPDGSVELTFAAWKRIMSSTSLIAALWYGPASKAVTGLGFLAPIPGRLGFFRVTASGQRLAEAFDEIVRHDADRYSTILATLEATTATEQDAIALWQIWAPETVSSTESEVFSTALFSEDDVGNDSRLIGKRSTTLALVMHHMSRSQSALSASDIRQGMALSSLTNGDPYLPPEHLIKARDSWLTLQMRQLQRLSMECLLSWCEGQILDTQDSDTDRMASGFAERWRTSSHEFGEQNSVSAALASLEGKVSNAGGFLEAVRASSVPNPFDLMNTIREQLRSVDHDMAVSSFTGILLCAAFANTPNQNERMLTLGGAPRLSLHSLRHRLLSLRDTPIEGAFKYVIEALIISQHFSTAVNRFDGQSQRLRLTIEENGLSALVSRPWRPTVTEDRLPTLLSLAAQAGYIFQTDGDRFTLPIHA